MRNYSPTKSLFLLFLFFLLFSACKKKKDVQDKLEFTEESHDYTAGRDDKKIEHIRFEDITASAGINFKHNGGAFGEKWMPETIGSGGGFFDYNNDGWIDIFLVNSNEWPGHESGNKKPTSKLYKNNGDNTFTDVTSKSGLDFSVYGMGSSFADFDADGDLDIYLTAVGSNKLLRNDSGTFSDVTKQMNVSGNDPEPGSLPAWSTGSAWIDIDRDGWLDLFVNNYVKWTAELDIYTTRDGKTKSYATPDVYEGESCRLYRNVQGKYFEDISEKAGLLNHEGKSLGVAVADFNGDLYPDIAVSNDTQPNFLYINNGDGTFTDKAVASGIGYDENGRARAGMGIDVADIANDDKLAIAIGNFSQEPLSLYTQTGMGELFRDKAGNAGLTKHSLLQLTFGLLFSDLDLDGYLDLITANGHIEPAINSVQKNITFAQRPQVFYNDQGRYLNISEEAGLPFAEEIVGRGVAAGDIDRDGDPDILITVNNGTPKLLLNETEPKNNYLTLTLKGKWPNLQAIGAVVELQAGEMKQKRMVRTGSSFLSQSQVSDLTFGIGKLQKVDTLKVYWPTTGKMIHLENIPVGESLTIEEE